MKRIDPKPTAGIVPKERRRIERAAPLLPGMRRPNFDAMFDPDAVSPLDDLQLTGNVEVDAAAEMDIVRRSFLDNDRADDDPFQIALDPEFYFVVCFQSRAQKDEFLEKSGLAAEGMGDKYLDGLRVARFLGVQVDPIPLRTKRAKPLTGSLRGTKIIPRGGDS